MRVKLHQDVKGRKSGETVDVPEGEGGWLVINGYASQASDSTDKVNATSVPAEKDPTVAENRESPEEAPPGVTEADAAPVPQGLGGQRASNVPELTNRADATLDEVPAIVEKAERGKSAVEKRSADVDQPAPEEGRAEPVEARTDAKG